MLKQNWRLISRFEQLGDILIIFLCFFVSYYGRNSLLYWNEKYDLGLPFEGEKLAPIRDYLVVLVIALVGYLVYLRALGGYSSMRLSTSLQLFRTAIVSSVFVFVTIASLLFLLKLDLSRSVIALFCGLVCLSLAAERFIVLRLLRYWRSRGRNFRNIIICGTGDQALRVAREIGRFPELGLLIRAFVELNPEPPLREVDLKERLRDSGFDKPFRVIYGTGALAKALEEYAIDEVIFADVIEVMPKVEEMVLLCSEQGIRTTLVADLFSVGIVKSGLSYFGDMPLIHFHTPPGDKWELMLKRIIDIGVSGLLLVLLLPFFLIISALIKLESRGPVIYVQRRVGLNGRLFHLIKFRSMQEGAERQLDQLRELNEMKGPAFKLTNDPRVTRVGRLLRRFSLDELPQLWNVLVGDMSLVGPRPPIPGEVSMYERRDRRRLSMRPGLTCTWQVSGRNEIKDFESWVKLDLEYIDNWSLTRDIILLFRTVPAVLFGTGAR